MTVEGEVVQRAKSTGPWTDPCGTMNEMGGSCEAVAADKMSAVCKVC